MLYNLFKKLFYSCFAEEYVHKSRVEPVKKEFIPLFPIGSKVIVIGNEPEPMIIGILVDYQQIGQSGDRVPVIESNGNKFVSFGYICLWTAEKEKAFNKLTWDEKYNVVCKHHGLNADDINRKNTKEYQERNKRFVG